MDIWNLCTPNASHSYASVVPIVSFPAPQVLPSTVAHHHHHMPIVLYGPASSPTDASVLGTVPVIAMPVAAALHTTQQYISATPPPPPPPPYFALLQSPTVPSAPASAAECFTGNTQVIVNHLGPEVRSRDLIHTFGRFGRLRGGRVIYDPLTQLPKGYGFVYFEDPQAARAAVASLDGTLLHGRVIRVGFAKKQHPLFDLPPPQ